MCVNYYARMRFAFNLMPQITAASNKGEISRVSSVLAAGSEGKVRIEDLALKKNYTLHACLAHCVVMTDFMVEELAKRYPNTAFSHSYPGTVKSGITNELSGPVRLAAKVLYSVTAPWLLQVQESGERHIFQLTSSMYPPASGNSGLPLVDGLRVCKGSDGEKGSGGYLLDWDGQATGDVEMLQKHREQDFGRKVWAVSYTHLTLPTKRIV